MTEDVIDIEVKLREAEAYHQMGLYREALLILDTLREQPAVRIDPSLKARIEQQTAALDAAIEEISQEDPEFQPETIAMLRESWTLGEAKPERNPQQRGRLSGTGPVQGGYRGVRQTVACRRVDLVGAARSERVFLSASPARPGPRTSSTACCTRTISHRAAGRRSNSSSPSGSKPWSITIRPWSFTRPCAKPNRTAPSWHRRSKPCSVACLNHSRYDYLLKSHIVNTGQLQNALALAKKSGRSVEQILCEHMQVSREAMGKSLSALLRGAVSPVRRKDDDSLRVGPQAQETLPDAARMGAALMASSAAWRSSSTTPGT